MQTMKGLRMSLNISRQSVARWCGVTVGAIASFEAGRPLSEHKTSGPVHRAMLERRMGMVFEALKGLAEARKAAQQMDAEP